MGVSLVTHCKPPSIGPEFKSWMPDGQKPLEGFRMQAGCQGGTRHMIRGLVFSAPPPPHHQEQGLGVEPVTNSQ